MKRLCVRRGYQGRGCGLFLAERAIGWASDAGYGRMVLDTLPMSRAGRGSTMTDFRVHTVVVLAVAFLMPLTGSRPGHSSTVTGEPPEGGKSAVADTIRQLFRAAEGKRVDRVEALHSYGPEFSKFDEFGLGREDADQTREAERRELASVKSFRAGLRDLKVDLFGEVALATFILEYTAETAQGLATATLRSTVVLRNDRGRWRIVHEHYSPLVARQ